MSPLARCCLTLTRFLLSAWVGASTLFVINGVRLVTSGYFDSVARDQISLIRFPPYYVFGFVAVGVSLICLLLARGYPRKLVCCLLVLSLLVMLADYFGVYRPLEAMITPPGQSRSSQFETYHRASMWINIVHVGLCLMGAMLISCPRRQIENDSD